VHAAACKTRWNGASVEAGRLASTAISDAYVLGLISWTGEAD